MKKEEKSKMLISKLKSEKEDVQYEISAILNSQLMLIIALATIGISIIISLKAIWIIALAVVLFIALMLIAHCIFFKPDLKKKEAKLNRLKTKIDEEYSILLKR